MKNTKTARFVTNNSFESTITNAAHKLRSKFNSFNLSNIESQVDEFYMNRYFIPKLRSLDTQLAKYSYHLVWVFTLLRKQGVTPKNAVFVDHGGGTGLFGMLAKEAGIGTVIYNDIDEKFLKIAQTASKEIGLPLDHYVQGDIDQLVNYVQKHNIDCNIIASYDVIEHIYDMDDFFKQIPGLSKGPLGLIMSSGANMYNPRCVFTLIPKQKAVEKEYVKLRQEFIKSRNHDLSNPEIGLLAKKSRGLRNEDINLFVSNYLATKSIKRNKHRTNTFDPFNTNTCIPKTGYWAEHFMNPFALKRILEENGLQCEVKTGRYHGNSHRRIRNVLNTLLRSGGVFSLPVAPYYSIIALRA